MAKKPAIFLDRDGTLNESVGYVNHESRFHLYPWTVEAIRLVREEGYRAVVVTNQSAIGRGYFPESLLTSLHEGFRARVRDAGTDLDGVYHCPHRPDAGCECRKPQPGMLLRAAEELDIDLEASWMVGDSYSDLEAGWNAGTRSALVKTGFGRGSLEHEGPGWPREPDVVEDNLFFVLGRIFWGPRS